jgi:hypothetical protein
VDFRILDVVSTLSGVFERGIKLWHLMYVTGYNTTLF